MGCPRRACLNQGSSLPAPPNALGPYDPYCSQAHLARADVYWMAERSTRAQ